MEGANAQHVPVQARAVRTRASLLSAAELEFSEHGYAATTARSIATRAGVATGSFYVYFKDKDAALRELGLGRFGAIAERVIAILDADPGTATADAASFAHELRRRVRSVVDAVVDYHREDPGLHAVLTERRHVDARLDEFTTAGERVLIDRLTALLDRWAFRRDSAATAEVLFSMVEGCVHTQILGRPRVTDTRCIRVLVDGIVAMVLPHVDANAADSK